MYKFKLPNHGTAPNFPFTDGQIFKFELLKRVPAVLRTSCSCPSSRAHHFVTTIALTDWSAYSHFIVVKYVDPGAGYMRHNRFLYSISFEPLLLSSSQFSCPFFLHHSSFHIFVISFVGSPFIPLFAFLCCIFFFLILQISCSSKLRRQPLCTSSF
jgi:hypothetical protein